MQVVNNNFRNCFELKVSTLIRERRFNTPINIVDENIKIDHSYQIGSMCDETLLNRYREPLQNRYKTVSESKRTDLLTSCNQNRYRPEPFSTHNS